MHLEPWIVGWRPSISLLITFLALSFYSVPQRDGSAFLWTTTYFIVLPLACLFVLFLTIAAARRADSFNTKALLLSSQIITVGIVYFVMSGNTELIKLLHH